MASDKPSERSAEIRKRVVAAREIQKRRSEGQPGLFANAQMSSRMVREYCRIDEAGQLILKQAMEVIILRKCAKNAERCGDFLSL